MTMAAEKDFQKDLEALRADIAALTETVSRLAGEMADARTTMRDTVRDSVRSAAKDAAEAGEDLLSDAMKLGGDTAGAAADAARARVSSMEDEIKRNPVTAVLTALGIGFVIGIIGRR
jgi:ElaB/YqjD/DUF883 family membrane-anchored ribosome-binding protein